MVQFAAHLRGNRKANGDRGLADARGEDIEVFVVALLGRRKPATANHRYRGLHAFYRWLEDEEEIPHPMRKLRPGRQRRRQATRTHDHLEPEVAEILRQAAEADQHEDRLVGDARGDELPAELASKADRLARLRQAKAQLEAEAAAREQAYQQRVAAHTTAAKAKADLAGGAGDGGAVDPEQDRQGLARQSQAQHDQGGRHRSHKTSRWWGPAARRRGWPRRWASVAWCAAVQGSASSAMSSPTELPGDAGEARMGKGRTDPHVGVRIPA